jgi:hypothetical protein
VPAAGLRFATVETESPTGTPCPPQDFALQRLKEVFQYAFGDLDTEWEITEQNSMIFVKHLLGYDPFAFEPEVMRKNEIKDASAYFPY